MSAAKPRLYFDANPLIDLVKVEVGVEIASDAEKDAWHTRQIIRACQAGKIEIFTSGLTVAECTHVSDPAQLERAKPFFYNLLTSGKSGLTLVIPTLRIMEVARNLRWIHGIGLGGADAIHVATAMQFSCDELITSDSKLHKSVEILANLGLRVCNPSGTKHLPDDFRAPELFPSGKV